MNSRVMSALKDLDYQTILKDNLPVQSPLDAYAGIRSAIILGDLQRAQGSIVENGERLGEPDGFLKKFLRVQLRIYSGERSADVRVELLLLRSELPDDSYLKGEYHLVMGYFLTEVNEYRQGIRHHRAAADSYARAGLSGCEAIAVFNLCVSYEHLNERHGYDLAFRRLEQLVGETGSETVRFAYLRLRAYGKREKEDFEGALSDTRDLIRCALSLGRLRDVGGLVCLGSYLLMKLGRTDEIDAWMEQHAIYRKSFDSQADKALEEYEKLARVGLTTAIDAKRWLVQWKRLDLEGVNLIGLTSVLCDLLLKSREYEALGRVANQAFQMSLKYQQGNCLVDFRWYEILSKIRLGELARAKVLLKMYEADAREEKSVTRTQKAERLRSELATLLSTNEADSDATSGEWLIIDKYTHTLVIGNRKFSLTRKPLVEKFLCTLIEGHKPLALVDLFESLYSVKFHPLLHERRINSLIDRARAIVGDAGLIIRREGCVGFSERVSARIDGDGTDLEIARRRAALRETICQSRRPLTISDLESRFDYSRRTLQLDLKHLARTRVIGCEGATRARRYFALAGPCACTVS